MATRRGGQEGRKAGASRPAAGAHKLLRAALGAGFLLLFAQACAHGRAAKPDVTPRLAESAPVLAAEEAAQADPEAGPKLGADELLEHAISRASFGPRAAEHAAIEREGIAAWLEEQLHPEAIDDAALEQRLAKLALLPGSTAERIQQLAAFRKQQQEERERRAREEAAQDKAAQDPATPVVATPEMSATAMVEAAPAGANALHANENGLHANQNMLHANDLPKGAKKELGKIGRGPGFDFTLALGETKLLRAVYSKRQLLEVMTDFWFNHFNIFAGKDREAALLPAYENDVIRANALGSFRELLFATAHSPAMLIYLDNWRSTAADAPKKGKGKGPDGKARKGRGLNENYARELLELHTLGVEGGYSQADVTEVARCFTGWSVDEPAVNPVFAFHPRAHDDGEKHVLGETLPAGGGIHDGERVLELILKSPSTARFISGKLVRRFVSDDPPQALVTRVAQTYLDTLSSGGDIRSMLRTIFASPEMWSRRARGAKMRSPLELVAAAARALDANVDDPITLARQVGRIGEPLFAYAPPTGYGDTAATWASSGALLARIDFGLALAAGQLEGVGVDLAPLASGARAPEEVLARASLLLGTPALSDSTRKYVLEQLQDLSLVKKPELMAERAVGLLLGAPELQRR